MQTKIKTGKGRRKWALAVVAVVSVSLFVPSGAAVQDGAVQNEAVSERQHGRAARPNYDAFLESAAERKLTAAEHAALKAASRPGTRQQMERRTGVPTTLWAADPGTGSTTAAKPGRRPHEVAARGHLKRLASHYRLSARDVDNAKVASVHDTGRGGVVVDLRQEVDGIEVFREELNVLMNRKLELIATTGYLSSTDGAVPAYDLEAKDALSAAAADLTGKPFDADDLESSGAHAGFELFSTTRDDVTFRDPARAKRVMYRLPDELRSAYHVELSISAADGSDPLDYAYVISADDGRVLNRTDLTFDDHAPEPDAFTYRVWADSTGEHFPLDGPQGSAGSPHPTGVPDRFQPTFAAPDLVALSSGPISTGDPWLPADASATIGNNAEAYADVSQPDGFQPGSSDLHAALTAPNTFDRAYDTTMAPNGNTSQQQAAVTQLFYDVNFFHDWYYEAGFDEASGNAQADNYGRGGVEGDSMRVEAQDFEGRNNANMFTPSDGFRPRMQMFVWDGPRSAALTVNSPPGIAGSYEIGVAAFGPNAFDLSADLALVNDGIGSATDGCQTPFVNAADVTGKIAIVDRGSCTFAVKAKNAQTSGAAGLIVVNNSPAVVQMGGVDPTIVLPSVSVSLTDGNTFKTALQSGTVNATLRRVNEVDRDSAIDNQMVAHEWGHYISRRLTPSLGTTISGGLGEGWSDFHAMLMTVKPEDAANGFNGVYGISAYSAGGAIGGPAPNNSFYFGIRRVPYSTDFTKNALTFKHISDGISLPGVPTSPAPIPIRNSEVHNTGEIWATMLWEAYAGLLRDGRLPFEEARDRMRDYLVASYKLMPADPTLLEARDALLMAAYAEDRRDFDLFWEAFARRGAGSGAVAPDRYSTTNSPVTESYVVGGALDFVSANLADDQRSCDRDGFLDTGETGRLFVTLRNNGAQKLNGTTATISSNNPNVRILDDKITFSATHPHSTTTSFSRVSLMGGAGRQALDFTISFDDPGLDPSGPFTAHHVTVGGANITRSSSATDDVESPVSAWNAHAAAGQASWERDKHPDGNHVWHGPDAGEMTDTSLVSPPLAVGADEFSFTFRHRFSFEQPLFDGGVIELSTDGGSTWTDIGPGYNGVITDETGNPLANRSAYVNASPGYPAFTTGTVDLGTAYAGQTVLVRFRIGTDFAVGGEGWDVDDLVFNGLSNTPFHELVADPGCR